MPSEQPPPNLDALVADALKAAGGDATECLKALVADQLAMAQDRAIAKTERQQMEDVLEFQEYKALGMTPEEVGKLYADTGRLKAECEGHERGMLLDAVAATAGVSAAVLKRLDSPEIVYEVRENRVWVKAGDGPRMAFDAFAAKTWPDMVPALRPGAKSRQPATPNRDDGHILGGRANGVHRNGTAPPPPPPKDVGAIFLQRARRMF
jgi:hypothetical protein